MVRHRRTAGPQHADLLDAYVGDWIAAAHPRRGDRGVHRGRRRVAPVYNARDLVEDEHVRATEMLTEVDDDDLGPVLQHNVMWRMSATPGRIRFTGRALGADTDDVLARARLRPTTQTRPATAPSEGADPMTDPTDPCSTPCAGGLGVVDLGRPLTGRHAAVAQPPAFWHTLPRRHGDMVRADGGSAPPTT